MAVRNSGDSSRRPKPPSRGKRIKSRRGSLADVASRLPEAREADSADAYAIQLATRVNTAPVGEHWLHEIKFDGYRMLALLKNGDVRLITRGGQDWTSRYPAIADALAALQVCEAVLDGELIAIDERGQSNFQSLQNARRGRGKASLQFQAFDLLHADGWDIRRSHLVERKKLLCALLKSLPADSPVRFSEHHQGNGPRLLANACKMRLEGLISKIADAPYLGGRSRSWVKSKCGDRQEFVIGGYTEPRASRAGFGALLLGYYDSDGELTYCGRVGTGFDDAMLRSLHQRLRKIESDKCPFDVTPTRAETLGAHWVKPRLVAEVGFAQWTATDRIRHPVFVGLREDKSPREVHRETVAATGR